MSAHGPSAQSPPRASTGPSRPNSASAPSNQRPPGSTRAASGSPPPSPTSSSADLRHDAPPAPPSFFRALLAGWKAQPLKPRARTASSPAPAASPGARREPTHASSSSLPHLRLPAITITPPPSEDMNASESLRSTPSSSHPDLSSLAPGPASASSLSIPAWTHRAASAARGRPDLRRLFGREGAGGARGFGEERMREGEDWESSGRWREVYREDEGGGEGGRRYRGERAYSAEDDGFSGSRVFEDDFREDDW
ncbi:hypothetical protein OF83DRAFT_1174187 [Amylostereum chailletii]|nr:hypothetical protein OF83DRAFT_1174187 [Amylostereum chailletii]